MTTGKTIALTIGTFVSKVMFMLFNMLTRFFSQEASVFSFHGCSHRPQWFLEPKKIKFFSFHCFPIYLPWTDGTRCHDEFMPTFSLSSFILIKRHFSSSSPSASRVVSSTYLRLLIFLLAILISACNSSSSVFCMMYFAYKLNRQSNNIQLWCSLFPILNQSVVTC